jgi:hypothetical protein
MKILLLALLLAAPESELSDVLWARTRAWLSGDQHTYTRYTVMPGAHVPERTSETGSFELKIISLQLTGRVALIRYELTQYLGCEEGGPFDTTTRIDVFYRTGEGWKLVAFDESTADGLS